MSKLDYCNVALASLPSCDLDRLQSVINAAARLTVGAQRHDHITPLLADLHWLRIPQRIQYKLCVQVLVYQCVQGSAPSYLQNAIFSVASAESRRRLRSASSADLMEKKYVLGCHLSVNKISTYSSNQGGSYKKNILL